MAGSPSTACLSEAELLDLADGIPSPQLLTRLDEHLDGCPHCRERLSDFFRARASGTEWSTAHLPAGAAGAQAPRPESSPARKLDLQPGTPVGRFLILHPAGQG